MCFINDAGYRYYFPALVRLCVESDSDDYYIGQLLFQLTYDGPTNRHLACFNTAQKAFVRDFCWYLLDEKIDEIHLNGDEDLLAEAMSLWGGAQ